ncbi:MULTISPECIES: helix-turn-helix domain-containing protein [Priestia]|jgi:transcriptional regulator with XRE-family HTH domain|uniref:helix-turn-helix domain-containing protein n=1 Tax=Priestia TaxID=2800373 RepID=UPI00204062FC|nr:MULTISPECIES: helix-turn-helix transcriptional regulator [Priestia]MCM3771217.1 helix-turn-helix transcriptional regulator [Priestia aryabhattai]MDY0942643.1 helix-turn-helix transcriptional regulator [Priestia megaterium]
MDKDLVKLIRKSFNMNQRDFAKAVNCSFSLIALVEVGKRRVTKDLENKIKVAFNLDDPILTTSADDFFEKTS